MKKILRFFWVIPVFLSVTAFTYFGLKIAFWQAENKETEKIMSEIIKKVEIEEVPVNKEEEIIIPPSSNISEKDDYYDFINLPLINVNLQELKKINPETIGFLKVNGTNINYPVVQTNDNDYYLTHTFDGSKNGGGWVFLDYRNNINQLQDNSIIYAHGRENETMFGSLKNVLQKSWQTEKENHVIYLSTENKNFLWQVFSTYKIPTETYYLTSEFGSEENHQKFIDTIIKRSNYDYHTSVSIEDKILTLSTCLNDEEKVVLHAKLIKQKER